MNYKDQPIDEKAIGAVLLEMLLEKIAEADRLVSVAENNKGYANERRSMAMIRWMIVADEATAIINQAKEHLDEPALLALAEQVEKSYPGAWSNYGQNIRRFKQLGGKEVFE